MMILSLFTSSRQVVRTFLYWNLLLRARYQCKDNSVYRIKFTSGDVSLYHRIVWQQLGQMVSPVITKVPVLGKVQAKAITWFRGY